jgi:hypothetical protein
MQELDIILAPRGAEVVYHQQGVLGDKGQGFQGVIGAQPASRQVAGVHADAVVLLG